MQTRQAIKEIRCTCGKMLAKVSEINGLGVIEIKCGRCQKTNVFKVSDKTNIGGKKI